jgi:hypothetical protein
MSVAGDIAGEMPCDLASDLASASYRASDLARDLAGIDVYHLGSARDRALALADDLTRARDLVQLDDLASVSVRARDLARDLAGVLALALARATYLHQDRHRHRDFSRARELAGDLSEACEAARRLERRVVESSQQKRRPDSAKAAQPAVAVTAVRLARSAVRILPVGCRDRYDGEFASELHEIAAEGASRWAQLSYGLRLLDRAWQLRAELREAAVRQVAHDRNAPASLVETFRRARHGDLTPRDREDV